MPTGGLVGRLRAAAHQPVTNTASAEKDDSDTGLVFSEWISDLRSLEFQRMQTLEARGARICQTNLAILTGGIAVAAFLLGKLNPSAITPVSGAVLTDALLALIASLVYGSVVQAGTSKYLLADKDTLGKMVGSKWQRPTSEARFNCARRDVETINSLSEENETRAKRLQKALDFQIAFVVLVSLAIAIEIAGRVAHLEHLYFHWS